MLTTGTAPVILESISLPTIVTELTPQEPAEWDRISSFDPAEEVRNQPENLRNVPADTMAYISAAPVITQEVIPPPAALPAAAAEVKGGIPSAGTGKLYRIQVGAYKIARNAVDAFDRLKSGGLNPAYEQSGEFYRVVLAGIRAEDVSSLAEKLGAVGFREVFIREEP